MWRINTLVCGFLQVTFVICKILYENPANEPETNQYMAKLCEEGFLVDKPLRTSLLLGHSNKSLFLVPSSINSKLSRK